MNEMSQSANEQPRKTHKVVYTIVERKGLKHAMWVRIGTAFENHDKSLRVFLDASPCNGELHIRDAEPRDDRRGSGRGRDVAAGTGTLPLEELS